MISCLICPRCRTLIIRMHEMAPDCDCGWLRRMHPLVVALVNMRDARVSTVSRKSATRTRVRDVAAPVTHRTAGN